VDTPDQMLPRLFFLCCCQHEDTWRSTQTNNMPSSHTSCKVHLSSRWDFGTFIVNCSKSVITV